MKAQPSPVALVVVGLIVILALGGLFVWLANNGQQQAAGLTPTATSAPHWATIWSNAGRGNSTSRPFTVPSHWRLLWSCDPASVPGHTYALWVDLKWHAPGQEYDQMPYTINAVQATCKPGSTQGIHETTDANAGSIYAVITTFGDPGTWSLTAQALQP